MPARIIRDELLTSERYWSVGIEAQRLFVHLLLNADALGRFSGKNYTIRAGCYPGHAIDPKLVEKLLQDLSDADLIRIYEADGERYLFIPRYRQRLRAKTSYYPQPPNGINDITEEKSDSSQTQDGLWSDSSRPKEGKGSKSIPAAPKRPPDENAGLRKEVWKAYSQAYQDRYGVPPATNAESNAAIKRFCSKIPIEDCAHVAAFFLKHSSSYYVSKGHNPNLLASDAAKLRTEWATGKTITQTAAMQADKKQANSGVYQSLMQEFGHENPKP